MKRPCIIVFFPGQPQPWSIAPEDRDRAAPALFADETGVFDFLEAHGVSRDAALIAIKRAKDTRSCPIALSART